MRLVRWMITFCMLSLLTVSTADAAKCDTTLSIAPIVVDLDNSNSSPDLDDCVVSTTHRFVVASSFIVAQSQPTYSYSNSVCESIRAPPVAN
ncbi:hypothetical protein SIO17_10715 [Pseudoalteromonas piscicida]|uniref:hypothetical protein n=1 Tax=Pseudoalteromonas piscicida TaxID=43662 RepID=UPI00026D0FAF|nr:hypothetical protein [Pseudoalteromonas piscicida]WPU34144.1 hypothetical protein SIO17_10715 [Pseudoalteromonas piscicida]